MDYFHVVMRHKVAFCKKVTQLAYKQIGVMVKTKISGFIHTHTERKNSLLKGRPVGPARWGNEVVANKSFEILFTMFLLFGINHQNEWLLAMLRIVQSFILQLPAL